VDRLSREGGRFIVRAGEARFQADQVVVAMANYQAPRVPAFAQQLAPDVLQLHSNDYKNLAQLQPGGVLIVGLGNSGADIAIEVARAHPTWSSGKENGHIPWRIENFFGRNIGFRIVRFIGHRVLTVSTPIGRKLRPKFLHRAAPLIRVKPKDLTDAGIKRVSRVVGVKNGKPVLADGSILDVKNVIWCTGFHPGFSWIDLPIFDEIGDPLHERGVVADVPGVYFLGLQFLSSMTSATVNGVGRDAEYIANVIESRMKKRESEAPVGVLSADAARVA
jgi:putative flavoprotein involved in K+ transport